MERVGFGVIGAGLFGENHALVYSRLPGVELVAVCDQNEERAREIAERYGARAHYTDYEKVLADPEIKAVSIATPDFAHAEIALAAAQAGKHILCEKPLATTVAEAQAIVDAAAQAGVKLMVDFHNRANPPFAAAREQVQSGAIGTPAYGYARLSNTTFVPLEMLSWANRTSALYFLGSHAVDIMRFILDDTVVRVQAVSRSGILQKLGVDAPDFHVAIAEFSRGAVVTFENAWILPQSQPMVYDFKVELLGSEGAIYLDPSHHGAVELHYRRAVELRRTSSGSRRRAICGSAGSCWRRLPGLWMRCCTIGRSWRRGRMGWRRRASLMRFNARRRAGNRLMCGHETQVGIAVAHGAREHGRYRMGSGS